MKQVDNGEGMFEIPKTETEILEMGEEGKLLISELLAKDCDLKQDDQIIFEIIDDCKIFLSKIVLKLETDVDINLLNKNCFFFHFFHFILFISIILFLKK